MIEKELLDAIVDICDIREDIAQDFPMDAPLIGPDSELGLDSLDAVEIVFMIQDVCGIRLQGQDQGREILVSLRTLADFIQSKKAEKVL